MEATLPAGKKQGRLSRLVALFFLMAALYGAVTVWRAMFSEEALEKRLTSMSLAEIEAESRRRADEPLVFYHLARVKAAAADPAGAEEALRWALRLRPEYARARAALAGLMLADGRELEAAQQLRQAAKDDPAELDVYLGLALLYQRRQSWRLQADSAEAATRAAPENASGWRLWGEALTRLKDYRAAAEKFEHAAELDPANAELLALASAARLSHGALEIAERHSRQAVSQAPRDPVGYAALGQVLLLKGRAQLPPAIEAFQKAASLGADSGAAQLGLAQALLREERPVEAEAHFRLALRQNTALNEARYGLAQALNQQGREKDAAAVQAEFDQWITFERKRVRLHDRVVLQPDRAELWFQLAEMHLKQGLRDEAHRLTRSGLRRAPSDSRGLALLRKLNVSAQ